MSEPSNTSLYPEERFERCPRCKGTGLDRWEEDDCEECFGEGALPNLAPIVKRIR